MTETDVEAVRALASELFEIINSKSTDVAHGIAALELASARVTLSLEETAADDARARAAELFEDAAALDFQALPTLTPWADSPWADEPIPYELTLCPSCGQPTPLCTCERFPL